MLQVVFRKVADVLREKELAERDRYETPLELATDHPVRRLISRFRKLSCSRAVGQPLGDFSPSDTLTVEMSLQALAAGRKTHSVDATADTSRRPSTCTDSVTTVSNGGAGVGSGRSTCRTLLSHTFSSDTTAAATNSDNQRTVNRNATTGNSEERALLSPDNVVPRTPRSSKWTSLLSSHDGNTIASAAPVIAADNQIFDDETASDKHLRVKHLPASRSTDTVDTTIVRLPSSRRQSVSSSCVDGVLSPVEHGTTVFDVLDLRSELSRQLGTVHGRIDDMSRRLDVVLRQLATTTTQRRATDPDSDTALGHLS